MNLKINIYQILDADVALERKTNHFSANYNPKHDSTTGIGFNRSRFSNIINNIILF